MKKLISLVAALALVLGIASMASAAAPKDLEVKAKGSWRVALGLTSNFTDFQDTKNGGRAEDGFKAEQRARVRFRFVWSEAVMAELYTEFGDAFWGDKASGADLDADERAIEVKRAFVQFKIPETDILTTAGIQAVALPNAGYFGSPVLDGDAGALVMAAPINDMVTVALGYTRLAYDKANPAASNEFDAIFAAVPLTFDGFKLTPWGTYAWLGKDFGRANGNAGDVLGAGGNIHPLAGALGDDVNPWWLGLAFSMDMFNPFVIYADFIYGSITDIKTPAIDEVSGWFADLAVQYKGYKMVKPEVFFSYSSGVKNDSADKLETMPFIYSSWGIAGTMLNGSAFADDFGGGATSVSSHVGAEPGFWLAGVALRDFSFINKLSHDLIFLYSKGTSDKRATATTAGGHPLGGLRANGLTKEDSYWEVDFNHTYKLYDSLALILELGYASKDIDGRDTDPMMKSVLGIKYDF